MMAGPTLRALALPDDDDALRGAVSIVRALGAAGHEAYLVGGGVRDLLLGRAPKDYDVATGATPDEVDGLFRRTRAVGKSFGVMHVMVGGVPYEVATFRRDLEYLDGRRPEGVRFCSAVEDVERRDFTVNALLLDPVREQVIDHVGGLEDLEAGLLRAVGDPRQRFAEDHLRILRAVRFGAELRFDIEAATWAAAVELSPKLARISGERIRDELARLLVAPDGGSWLERVADTPMLDEVLPTLAARRAREDSRGCHDSALVHALERAKPALDRPDRRANEVLGALLEPDSAPDSSELEGVEGSRVGLERLFPAVFGDLEALRISRVDQHEILGAVAVRLVAPALSGAEVARHRRVRAWRWPGAAWGLAAARRDAELRGAPVAAHIAALEAELGASAPDEIRPVPLLNGDDLVALGWQRGPRFGVALRALEDAQLDGEVTTIEEARAWVAALATRLDEEAP